VDGQVVLEFRNPHFRTIFFRNTCIQNCRPVPLGQCFSTGVPPSIPLLLLLIFEPILRNTVGYLLCKGDSLTIHIVSFSLFRVKQELLNVIYEILLVFCVPPNFF